MTVHTLYTCNDVHFANLITYYLMFILCNITRYLLVYTKTSSLHADCQPDCAPD